MITKDDPPKLYAVRLVAGGPRCACKAWYGKPADPITEEPLDRSLRWNVWLNGEDRPISGILMLIGDIGYVKGDPIEEAEYQHLLAVAEWAKDKTGEPEATPHKAIDMNKLKPIKFTKG